VANEDILKKRVALLEETIKLLEKDLMHDKLTGLKTRAFFEEEARVYFDVAKNVSIDHSSRRRQWFGFTHISFIFFDIDNFKIVNDSLGHLAGDEVLQSVAETIRTSVRDGDTAARWGGEEIALFLVGATERDAFHKAEEIRRQVENTRFGKFPDLRVTISGGVASANAGSTFEETLDRADQALYQAKRSGRNRVVAYSEMKR
jgi:diguanylate cyclase (GGDEF)-like protein